jgi:hypothetical protein
MKPVLSHNRLLEWGASVLFAVQAGAQPSPPPSSSVLSRSAMEGHIHVSDGESIENRILAEHGKLRALAAANPDSEALATLIFNRGMSAQELSDLASAHQLEVAGIELKVPVSQDDRVFTLAIGARDLMRFDGDLHTRLRRSIGHVRAELAALADGAEGDESRRFHEAAFSNAMDIYKVAVVGPARTLSGLLGEQRIAAIFVDESGTRVKEFRALQARELAGRKEQGPVVIRSLPAPTAPGPPRGVLPVDKLPPPSKSDR